MLFRVIWGGDIHFTLSLRYSSTFKLIFWQLVSVNNSMTSSVFLIINLHRAWLCLDHSWKQSFYSRKLPDSDRSITNLINGLSIEEGRKGRKYFFFISINEIVMRPRNVMGTCIDSIISAFIESVWKWFWWHTVNVATKWNDIAQTRSVAGTSCLLWSRKLSLLNSLSFI